ncbi:PREDICTED: ADP-ribosyl cyclase/cyclic ADP-ribose hydrolase 1 [Thamnophis sirtalis]|uniref:ADP-ribosyl cyclase/cyclic ADP-ribose hydrolase 1 n=1 Tax=Thamnophis sirtalis TaxID=35019 RepID=A0A6I9XNF0_9SAUR|nr:PREDICTED: ADP-ribosyl cyclase/cyclic ADP-ribose hydrolase 1 [Thamnophis sirtalis]XP_013915472.1 PREDICTED: ADP-ribosyl cyclase/cyclic ADP-ribose hydrolase 1 [Thamnophis sirtalis]
MPFQNSSSWTRKQKMILTGAIVLFLGTLTVFVIIGLLRFGKKKTPAAEEQQWKGKGTTEHLMEIVLGRCYNFINTINSELRNKDCLRVWKLFEQAFLYKDPCNVTIEDYQPLMDLARYPIPCNKSLFWSKTNDLAHHYTKTNHDFLTLEDTLLGYIADGITWCGNPSDSGVNYESCPKRTECENNPSSVYWKLASKMFAEASCGTVQVMLNGSAETGAFRKSSIFGSVEIVNLNPEKVSKMQIWLMHDIDGPQRESCTGPSIAQLREILENRNISVSCEDNYRPAQLLQCTRNPNHKACTICS